MSEEIINRVQKSGLVTIDLDDIELPKNILEIDIKCWLHEGLFLKEKEFRVSVLGHDWSKYKNSYVYVHCTSPLSPTLNVIFPPRMEWKLSLIHI